MMNMLVNTPPMGWNTWNTFGGSISDKLVRESADAFIEKGLKDAGYTYVVIDDCWSLKTRDPETKRIVPDPVKFPEGMKALSDYVHSRGLKMGMYSCAGQRTCADYPGSFDHEFLDAKTFAEWGVD
ncbi:MAG: glycoside hydrolase family 27 protein, partial [Clostridia bacterium]|nr:glycoside hydrolase family 27 protein [Clostridia bacterium]